MSWTAAKDIFPPFDAVSAQELLMSVIIMHPKHNLEMKYKNGVCVGGGCVCGVCVCYSSSAAAARLNVKSQIMML